MRKIWLLAVATCLLCRSEAQKPAEKTPEHWDLYTYASDGFAIGSPQVPVLTYPGEHTQYLVYWNEETDVVINVSFNRKAVDCSAWNAWAKGLTGNVIRVITVKGIPALESTGHRNGLQAGYTLDQCVDGRVYRFEAGWTLGSDKPPLIEKVLSSFTVLPKRSN